MELCCRPCHCCFQGFPCWMQLTGRGIWGWSETVGSSVMDIGLVSRVAWLLQGRGIFISSLEVETAFHHNTYLVAAPQEFHLKGFFIASRSSGTIGNESPAKHLVEELRFRQSSSSITRGYSLCIREGLDLLCFISSRNCH